MPNQSRERIDPPIQWVMNSRKSDLPISDAVNNLLPEGASEATLAFHQQIPDYEVTQLHQLKNLANHLNLGNILAKDEASRMGLNAFKSLGGSYAIYRFIRKQLGVDDLSYEDLFSAETREKLGDVIFTSATDGNHGKGLAWATQRLGFKCVIYVHKDTSQERIKAIEDYDAEVRIVDGNYDRAVRQCSLDAEANGWQVISDTSWDNYEEIPTWVMQGYTTLLAETVQQMSDDGLEKPTHVFAQAGVGAFAASVCAYFKQQFGEDAPTLVIVEPSLADCLYHSAKVADGKAHNIEGDLQTIMAGLACGEPSPLAWEVLRDCADIFLSVPDYVAAKGMRIYGVPIKGDHVIISGESGAVTLGALYFLMNDDAYSDLRETLQLDADSRVLVVNTEGNTDRQHYRNVIWDGRYPVPEQYQID